MLQIREICRAAFDLYEKDSSMENVSCFEIETFFKIYSG